MGGFLNPEKPNFPRKVSGYLLEMFCPFAAPVINNACGNKKKKEKELKKKSTHYCSRNKMAELDAEKLVRGRFSAVIPSAGSPADT